MLNIKFHPNLQRLLKFNDGFPVCPNCKTAMVHLNENLKEIICYECTKEIAIYPENERSHAMIYDCLQYSLIIKKQKYLIYINFPNNQTTINFNKLIIPHTNLPYFNELKMRDKLKLYLTMQ